MNMCTSSGFSVWASPGWGYKFFQTFPAHAVSTTTEHFVKKMAECLSVMSNISMIFQVTKEDMSAVQDMAWLKKVPNMLDDLWLKWYN